MELTKSIRRQLKRHLHSDTPETLLKDLVEGNNDALDIASLLKNLPAFIESINLAYADYDDKLKISSRSLEISSMELNTSNRKLENLISSMNAMMDGLGQGLLFFDRKAICSGVFSKICLDFFKGSPEGKNIAELLALNEQEIVDFELWLSAVFDTDSALDISELYDLAPQTYKNKEGKTLRLEYRAMKDNRGKMMSVLMIVTDITQEIIYNSERLHLEDHAARIVAIAGNRNNFNEFLLEVQEFITNEVSDISVEKSNPIAMRLHTYKGLASSFYLSGLAMAFHEMEDMIAQKKLTPDTQFDNCVATIRHRLKEAEDLGKQLFGESFSQTGRTKIVSLESLIKLKSLINGCDENIKKFFESEFLQVSLDELLQPFVTEIKRLCAVQQKTYPMIELHSYDIKIEAEKYNGLISSFIHIARNIVDHGLEYPAQRVGIGKKPEGKISVLCLKKDGNLTISFSDDGAGIDTEKLIASIKQRGSYADHLLNPDNILQTVFLPSISTSQETNILSGRGIGLATVREEAEKLGGSATIASEKGVGTTLTISVPL